MTMLTVQFWGDLICPICPVGHAMLNAGIAQFPLRDSVEIVYRSSRLRPGVPPHTVNSYLKQKYGAHADAASIIGQVEQMGAEAGLTYKIANTLAGDTMDAHRVVHFATSHGLQMQMVERLHRSHFAEEANIFDEDTLVRLAGEVGLDRNEIASILAGDMFKAGVEADEAAAQDVGASSVPFFLIDDRFPIQGSEARERIPAIMDRAWQAQAQRLSGHDKVFQPCRVVTAGNGRKWFRSAFRLTASPLPHIGSMYASSDSFCQSDIPLSTHFGHRNR